MNYLRDNSYKPQGIHMNPTESQEIFQDWQNVNNSKINVSLLMRKEWRECLKNSRGILIRDHHSLLPFFKEGQLWIFARLE